jgi:hypothetical protein
VLDAPKVPRRCAARRHAVTVLHQRPLDFDLN